MQLLLLLYHSKRKKARAEKKGRPCSYTLIRDRGQGSQKTNIKKKHKGEPNLQNMRGVTTIG